MIKIKLIMEKLHPPSTMPDTPILWTKDNTVPVIVQFTGDCSNKIDVIDKNKPFLWLKVFSDDDPINSITAETNWYTHQYLYGHELSPQS
jgi:hypothetical protein